MLSNISHINMFSFSRSSLNSSSNYVFSAKRKSSTNLINIKYPNTKTNVHPKQYMKNVHVPIRSETYNTPLVSSFRSNATLSFDLYIIQFTLPSATSLPPAENDRVAIFSKIVVFITVEAFIYSIAFNCYLCKLTNRFTIYYKQVTSIINPASTVKPF